MSEEIERDPYTGHPKPPPDPEPESPPEVQPPVERTIKISLSSVDDEATSCRFLAAVDSAPFLCVTADTPGQALAALGAALDANLVDRAWNGWVAPDGSGS